ncbi:hypothetical protein [Listeria cornellensis]|uniref:Uncharacterized protein n=1 Tax=Listeria cornellensis FSL F6-0969 TaxID=1265820 RepID=W7BV37_9LIST|nr:hypothetical protein [Listeria cornellensis]EUJ24208.1 hypothetical protein PCORN_18866 [Listeria cornellensis FSL F6-0969]
MVGTLNKNDQAYGDNNLYHIGKILSDIGSIAVGGLGMAGGSALVGGGLVLDVTGVGAIAGVPANIAGVAIATSSGVVAKNGTQNIIKDASDLISNIKSGAGELSSSSWNKGSFKSPTDSLENHFKKHGTEVGAKDADQYLRKAEEFAKTAKKRSTKSPVKGAVDGVIRYKKDGKYIDLAPDGSIVSFGKQ